MSTGFRYNPYGQKAKGLKVLIPERYKNSQVRSVELIGPDGRVFERGRYARFADNRENYHFSKPGWAYPSNIKVRMVTRDGKSQVFDPRSGLKSGERGPSGRPLRGGSGSGSTDGRPSPDDEDQDQGEGSEGEDFEGGGEIQDGEDYDSFFTEGGNEVAIPNFVDFNPEEYFVSLDEAIDYGRAEGQYNLDLFRENFDRGKEYALESQQTELEGLESFVPRTTNLIRRADAQGNEDILRYSDVFDARNERAMRKATLGNVALRRSIAEQSMPGAFDAVEGMRERAEGDVRRVRARESTSFLDDVIKEQSAKNARARGGDIAATTGFGADSSAGTEIMDRFDAERRIELEAAKRADFRQGDTSIYAAEGQVGNAVIQGQNLFNTVIAPGIRDFQPIQPTPRVTDVGGQIRVMPAVDAGSIQREMTNQQNAVSMLSPQGVFNGSIDTQKYNSGVGLQALGFQQEQNNTVAGAVNAGLDQDRGDEIFDAQLQAQQDALDIREQSQQNQGLTQLGVAGLGVLGNMVNGWMSEGDPGQKQQQQQSIGGWIGQGIKQYGQQFYNMASDFLNDNLGIDIGEFDIPGSDPGHGGNAWGSFGNSGSSGGSGSDIYSGDSGDSFDMGSSNVNWDQTQAEYDQELAELDEGLSAQDDYYQQISANDWDEDVGLSDSDYMLGGSFSGEADQAVDYEFDDAQDSFDFDAGLGYEENEYVPLARVASESSGVEVIPKKEIVNSFIDTGQRDSVMQSLEQKGIDKNTMTQAYTLYDNWDKMDDSERAFASAQLLNNLADSMGVVDGTVPGAIINVVRQGANLYENWDAMSDGQKARAGAQVAGSLGGIAATMAGAGGPVGAGIVFGAAAFGRAAQIAIDQGIDGIDSAAALITPMESMAANMLNQYTGNNFHHNDVSNAALIASGYGAVVAAANMAFDLDLDFTSGKPKTQQFRDSLRKHFEKIGVTRNHQMQLADGSTFDMGKDGGAKLKNVGKNIDGKTERSYYDVDFSNPIAGQVTAWTDVLARLAFRHKDGGKMVGHLVNAFTAKDPTNLRQAKSNAKDMAYRTGLDYGKGIKILDSMQDDLSKDEYEAFRNSWMDLMLS